MGDAHDLALAIFTAVPLAIAFRDVANTRPTRGNPPLRRKAGG